jgi:hypothetical protein
MDKDWHPDRQNRLMNMIYVALSSAFLPRPGDILFTHFRMVFSVHGNGLGENDIPFCFLVSHVNVSFCGQEYYCTISLRQVIHILQAKRTNPLQGMLMNAKVNEESSTLRFTRVKYF